MTVHVLVLGVQDPALLDKESSSELSKIVADWICDISETPDMVVDFFTMTKNTNSVVCQWKIGVRNDVGDVPFDKLISKLHPDHCRVESVYQVPTLLM